MSMLVLTRRETEKLLFPTLGITIEVLRIRGNKTRLGVDAPAEIPVVRQELAGLKSVDFTAEASSAAQLSQLHRAVRERLDRAAVALNQLHRRLEQQGDSESQQRVLEIFRELNALERETGDALEPPVSRGPRALLVEDDENQRELLGGFLRLSGFDVTLACDGRDALDYLSLHAPPDVVLLDMLMPRCDGASFVREVRSTTGLCALKLFAVSATDPSSLGVTTGAGGIDRWFPKPVDVEDLVHAVSEEVGPLPSIKLAT
jgi:carbon storage regulator CsrA